MNKIVQFLFLSAIVISLWSCKKSEDNDISPAETVSKSSFYYHRVITYLQPGASKELLFPSKSDTNVVAVLNQNHLLLSFYTKPFSDDIMFDIMAGDLNSEIVGNYPIRIKGQSEAVVNANYIINFYNLQEEQHSFEVLASLFNGSGILTISKYDKQRNTISGTFQLSLQNVPDPTIDVTSQNLQVVPLCNVAIDGSFDNILLHY